MLENPSTDFAAAAAIKRYAPPNQRSRSLGRRKSGGGLLERAYSYGNDGEPNPAVGTKSWPIEDHGDAVGHNPAGESLGVKLIPLHGCCKSEAFQLLHNRWTAAMSSHNSCPEDSAERPVMYTRKSSSSWSHAIFPHLLIQPKGDASTRSQKDFLAELRRGMDRANSCTLTPN